MSRLAPRWHAAQTLVLVLALAACGRLTGQAPAAAISEPPAGESPTPIAEFLLPGSEMLPSPRYRPWAGGDPTWALSLEESNRLISSYTNGFAEDDDPALDGYPRMPETCYELLDVEGGYPQEKCLYPVLRQLVSEDALRFYRETGGSMLLGLAGDGPVKVADIWWGPFGTNDHPGAEILTPQGFMSSSPHEWAPYATAEEEASGQDVLQRIIAATGDTTYVLNHVYPWQVHSPEATATGWMIATTRHLNGSCHGCDVEFGGRFVLEFDEEGTPTDARFDGFCWFDYFATDNPNADRAAILALREELPLCEPARYPDSVIDWENPSQWQG